MNKPNIVFKSLALKKRAVIRYEYDIDGDIALNNADTIFRMIYETGISIRSDRKAILLYSVAGKYSFEFIYYYMYSKEIVLVYDIGSEVSKLDGNEVQQDNQKPLLS